ncbi:hypothetical protein FPQ18DRAFT_417689 [Pyronema domesticum]|nr:hypothetical protein FPQ18DRAFT_417689 [Pyronema domesticum]
MSWAGFGASTVSVTTLPESCSLLGKTQEEIEGIKAADPKMEELLGLSLEILTVCQRKRRIEQLGRTFETFNRPEVEMLEKLTKKLAVFAWPAGREIHYRQQSGLERWFSAIVYQGATHNGMCYPYTLHTAIHLFDRRWGYGDWKQAPIERAALLEYTKRDMQKGPNNRWTLIPRSSNKEADKSGIVSAKDIFWNKKDREQRTAGVDPNWRSFQYAVFRENKLFVAFRDMYYNNKSVQVIRGGPSKEYPDFYPKCGYRYDGLYRVDGYRLIAEEGFYIFTMRWDGRPDFNPTNVTTQRLKKRPTAMEQAVFRKLSTGSW